MKPNTARKFPTKCGGKRWKCNVRTNDKKKKVWMEDMEGWASGWWLAGVGWLAGARRVRGRVKPSAHVAKARVSPASHGISGVHPYADPHWYDNIYILHIRSGPYTRSPIPHCWLSATSAFDWHYWSRRWHQITFLFAYIRGPVWSLPAHPCDFLNVGRQRWRYFHDRFAVTGDRLSCRVKTRIVFYRGDGMWTVSNCGWLRDNGEYEGKYE